MLTFLHGYFLSGSGSNLWNRNILEALCKSGNQLLLLAQENHPEKIPFIEKAYRHSSQGVELFYEGSSPYSGSVTLHKPEIGKTLPVFVSDHYEEFDSTICLPDMTQAQIETYIAKNLEVMKAVHAITPMKAVLANHLALMPTVAERFFVQHKIPYWIVPHGSAIEYAIKKDDSLRLLAASALQNTQGVFHLSEEIRTRIQNLFPEVSLENKWKSLSVGVNCHLFQPTQINRSEHIKSLIADLKPENGRPSQSIDLSKLRSIGKEQAKEKISEQVSYNEKAPDQDLHIKLEAIDWEKKKVVVFAGRLIAAKGLHCLLAALPKLIQSIPELQVVVVGHGPYREIAELVIDAADRGDQGTLSDLWKWESPLETMDTGPYFSGVPAPLITPKKIRPHILFTGFLNHKRLSHIFACSDVAVFPSLVLEAGPMVFLEALASGCLPMGTHQGGIAQKIALVESSLPDFPNATLSLGPKVSVVVSDLQKKLPIALEHIAPRSALHKIARDFFDWSQVANSLISTIKTDK